MTNPLDDFEKGKAIAELLKDLTQDRQERVLRWVAEAVGTHLPPAGGRGPVAPVAGGASLPAPAVGAPAQKSLRAFIEEKRPRSDAHFATAVAYYYGFEAPATQRSASITAAGLRQAARDVDRERFPKPAVTLNNAKKQGYLEAVRRGQFAVTTVGENLVAMTLPTDATRGAPAKAGRRTKRKPAPRRKLKRTPKASKKR